MFVVCVFGLFFSCWCFWLCVSGGGVDAIRVSSGMFLVLAEFFSVMGCIWFLSVCLFFVVFGIVEASSRAKAGDAEEGIVLCVSRLCFWCPCFDVGVFG